VRRLPATMPESDRLSKGSFASHKDHWIGWLEEYDGPGYYDRADWNRNARHIYQHLNNANMIVWINEAAGESPTKIKLAIREMQRAGSRKQTAAKIARTVLPWERAATLLFKS
jgi:hypothetical protein